MSEQVADLLDDAADLLERSVWLQGRAGGVGEFCAESVLWSAAGGRDITGEQNALRLAAYRALAGLTTYPPFIWNDRPGRTKQEVLDAFRKAAKYQRMRAA
jgi:hypothetical protein